MTGVSWGGHRRMTPGCALLLFFLCSVDELIPNHQLENNFCKAVFKYPVPLGHLELPSLRQALCVRQGRCSGM